MNRILLTGGSGFVGAHLSKLLPDARYVVRGDKFTGFNDTYSVESINEKTNWLGAFDNISCIVHLAGLAHSKNISKEQYFSVNTEGTLHFARQAAKAGVRRFIFVSSIGVNGFSSSDMVFSPYSEMTPHNHYAKSKSLAELGLKKIASETGLEVIVVRPTLVYGPKAPGNFGLLTKLVHKLPLLPFGLADNKRDFIAVQNLVDLLMTCVNHPNAAGHTFLASDCQTVSIKSFTNAVGKGLGKTVIQLPVPVSLMRLTARLVGKSAMMEQLLGNLQVDSSNAHDVLGWVPPYTMEQAMASLSENKK